ncbi:MAG: pyruvate kinase, partial [bacterium]|nr:pyruvate kinase [bacterium]
MVRGTGEERSIRRTSIVCTIGPASESEEGLELLARAGMDVARLNFSHGTREEKREIIRRLRRVEARLGRPIAIMADLQGPKLRVGEFEGGRAVVLERGRRVILTVKRCVGTAERIWVNYRRLPAEVGCGDHILLADGAITLRVE